MRDLFGDPTIPGLHGGEAFVSRTEKRMLADHIDTLDLVPFRFQGWLGKRLTHSFGMHYDFDRGALAATTALPEWPTSVRDRAEPFAGLPAGTLEQALLIRYDAGAGIG